MYQPIALRMGGIVDGTIVRSGCYGSLKPAGFRDPRHASIVTDTSAEGLSENRKSAHHAHLSANLAHDPLSLHHRRT